MKLALSKYASVLILLLSPMAVNAIPITFTFDMPAFNQFDLTGTTSILDVTVDNGGTSSINQSFLNTEITVLSTDLTGPLDTLFYRNMATVIVTDALSQATMNFMWEGQDTYTIASTPTGAIQLRNQAHQYLVTDRTVLGALTTRQSPNPYTFTGVVAAQEIPEPSSYALVGAGVIAFGVLRRKKRKLSE